MLWQKFVKKKINILNVNILCWVTTSYSTIGLRIQFRKQKSVRSDLGLKVVLRLDTVQICGKNRPTVPCRKTKKQRVFELVIPYDILRGIIRAIFLTEHCRDESLFCKKIK